MKKISDLNNWFVLRVPSGQERFVKNFIEENSFYPIKMILFTKELIYTKKAKKVKVVKPLFPGYLFIYKNVAAVMDIIKTRLRNTIIYPICFKKTKCKECFTPSSPCMVNSEEMKFLLEHTDDYDFGLYKLSYGHRIKNDFVFYKGPLKRSNAKILWINEKKNKACVALTLFNRSMNVVLGIEVLKEMV